MTRRQAFSSFFLRRPPLARHRGGHVRFGDGCVGKSRAFKLFHDLAAREHNNPVAQALELDAVRRRHDHRDAAIGEFAQAFVDLGTRADVDAFGGLVDQDHLRLGGNFASDQHLLLVAARKFRGLEVVVLFDAIAGVDAEPVHHSLGQGVVALPVDHAGCGNAVECADTDVLAQPQGQKQSFFMAVVGDEPDSGVSRCGGGVALDGLALDAHRSAVRR